MKASFLFITISVCVLAKPASTVYICDSKSGKKYHLKNDCKGLSKCTHRIIEIKLEDAKKRGMGLCKFED